MTKKSEKEVAQINELRVSGKPMYSAKTLTDSHVVEATTSQHIINLEADLLKTPEILVERPDLYKLDMFGKKC